MLVRNSIAHMQADRARSGKTHGPCTLHLMEKEDIYHHNGIIYSPRYTAIHNDALVSLEMDLGKEKLKRKKNEIQANKLY